MSRDVKRKGCAFYVSCGWHWKWSVVRDGPALRIHAGILSFGLMWADLEGTIQWVMESFERITDAETKLAENSKSLDKAKAEFETEKMAINDKLLETANLKNESEVKASAAEEALEKYKAEYSVEIAEADAKTQRIYELEDLLKQEQGKVKDMNLEFKDMESDLEEAEEERDKLKNLIQGSLSDLSMVVKNLGENDEE